MIRTSANKHRTYLVRILLRGRTNLLSPIKIKPAVSKKLGAIFLNTWQSKKQLLDVQKRNFKIIYH